MKLNEIKLIETIDSEISTDEETVLFLEKNCSQWQNYHRPLWRYTNTKLTKATLRSTRERLTKSKGGSESIQKYIFSVPEYKNYPDRTKSLFCSTTQTVSIPTGNSGMTAIFPLDGITMGQTDQTDFNYINPFSRETVRIFGFSTIISILQNILGHNELPYTTDISKSIQRIKDKGEPRDGKYGYSDAERFIFNAIKNDTFIDYFTPEKLGLNLVTAETIKSLGTRQTEVWFEGKYIAIPQDLLSKILKTGESLHAETKED